MAQIATQAEDFPRWYQDVVREAELAESGMARGTMVIRPYGFSIWERIQREMDDRIKATGHENFYFPMFFPYALLEKEAEHVEGFAPEVAVVSHAGGEDLEEPLAVRPTSEAVIWATYAKWIQSYRDLPLLYNQWANVVRWEMRPRLFLRTTEFLWQEGHTAHETRDEAVREALLIHDRVYRETMVDVLALPVHGGRKSAAERFAGAVETYTLEAMMRDRKALQASTSHYLGTNFSEAYGVRYLDREGAQQPPHATSWGASTRLVGGVIMAHGDDQGLRLPPALAPIQVVIVPIFKSDEERARVLGAASKIEEGLSGTRVRVDDREGVRPGFKFNEWELKGVPVRLELGPRDLDAEQVTLASRVSSEKQQVALGLVADHVAEALAGAQRGLYEQAEAFRDQHTFRPKDLDELAAMLKDPGGFMVAGWCGSADCETRVKDETKATIRFLPEEQRDPGAPCIVCGQPGTEEATWGLAY